MKISFVIPTRKNLKYFKWAYNSIRKNQGNNEVWICAADDASGDGTAEYFEELSKTDKQFKFLVNEGPERVGHTILYDRIVNELVETDAAIIWHADMYLCPGALDEVAIGLYGTAEEPKVESAIVSLTRIEPPLHPPGPEKLIKDFGTEPEHFDEDALLNYASEMAKIAVKNNKTQTSGIFAPWAFMVQDFKSVHGHDPLFAPQSKEDSDIFNKFFIDGIELIQTWKGFVYHMTCRGSRFNPSITKVGQNSPEWTAQNVKSSRNFIRKWGHFVKHDNMMLPIVPNRYDIGIIIENANPGIIEALEVWCSTLYCTTESDNPKIVDDYIAKEQPNTLYDLNKRVKFIPRSDVDMHYTNACDCPHDVMVKLDATQMNPDYANVITNLSEILAESGQVGEMEFNMMQLKIDALKDYKFDLLKEQYNNSNIR